LTQLCQGEARLSHALTGVLRGEAALPRALVMRLIDEFRRRDGRRPMRLSGRGVALSDREWRVLSGLREGRTTAEIAGRLGVTEVTVRRHVSRILAKLHVRDRAAAVRLADEATGGPDY
jgi:Response regulator containing a CheY-like receiver domain and an HTH DNA-binding domain